jgi:hypothetical protein
MSGCLKGSISWDITPYGVASQQTEFFSFFVAVRAKITQVEIRIPEECILVHSSK